MTCDTRRPIASLAAATMALSAAAVAQAGDGPPAPYQDVQIVQSALDVLGYYDGPLDGDFDAETFDALERFILDSHFAGAYDTLNQTVVMFVGMEAGLALEESFGTNPTGTWDVDLSGLSAAEAEQMRTLHDWESLELCSSPLATRFEGMAYGTWRYGFLGVLALRDGALVPLPDPEYPDLEQPAFTFVDADTMQRIVDGRTETWHRCP